MSNPFRYQGPVAADRLIDRAAELDTLQRAAADRVAIRLAAPRRFGKTSLLEAHLAAMRQAGHRGVRVDFSKVASVGDAATRVARAFATLPADPQQTLARLLGRFGLAVGAAGLSISVGAAGRRRDLGVDDARHLLAELLDLPAVLHRADGDLTIVCFDEFQDLLVADEHLDGLMRSVIQHHGEAVAYAYAGSSPSLMRALFDDRERPFYGQARPLTLPPLPQGEAVTDIARLLAVDGLAVTGAVGEIVGLAAGHPQRTMLLAHHLYELLADNAEPQEGLAAAALDRALAEVADALQAVRDGLGRSEYLVLVALAEGDPPTGTRLAEDHGLARSTLKKALDRLTTAGEHVIVGDDGRPAILDPLFVEWLRRR